MTNGAGQGGFRFLFQRAAQSMACLLYTSNSALRFVHAVVVTPFAADQTIVKVGRNPVIGLIFPVEVAHAAKLINRFSIHIVVAGNHAALTKGGDVFQRMEAEAVSYTHLNLSFTQFVT